MDLAAAVPGIDLSHHDDARGAQPVDYAVTVAAVHWAILRVGDGGATDRSFDRHVDGLAGRLPLGTYLFCRPGSDPVAQALAWAGAVRRAEAKGATFPLGHWADLEATDGLSRVALARWIAGFLAAADDALGTVVDIYTSAPWWQNVDPGLAISGRLWWVARYPFGETAPTLVAPGDWASWVAARTTAAHEPHAPFDAPVAIWQWTSRGSGPAVGTFRPNALDADLMAAEVFAALTAEPSPPPQPTPAPPAPDNPEDDVATIVRRRKANPADEQDHRLYKTNGVWKERIQATAELTVQEAWDHACDDLGLDRGAFVDWDAGKVNRMTTIGDDPG